MRAAAGVPPSDAFVRPELSSHTNPTLIAHKLFLKSFCGSQLPLKSVNLSFPITNIKKKLTDSCGNRLLRNDFKNTLCEMNS
jgi:hypothetical protein